MTTQAARPLPDRTAIAPVTSREELIYLLSQACEIEHGLACVYLFAAHSLKSDVAEGGLTEAQSAMLRGWKRKLAGVAVEEMLHLAQVSNMLVAVGGAPHFRRTNFPLPSDAFSFGIPLALEPFTLELAERLVCYEMPEDGVLDVERQPTYDDLRARVIGTIPPKPEAMPTHCSVEPFEVDFRTVGEFYHKIATGFAAIPEAVLFIGPPEAQANARYVDFDGELVTVTDRASALAAIEMIVRQGEAPTADHPDAHFFVFDAIRNEYEREVARARETGIAFEPVRPVIANPMTHFYGDGAIGQLIRDELTHNVADLYNVAYDTMLLMLLRFFAHTDETDDELELLSRATLRMMASVLRPLGEALTKMPAGTAYPDKTAGPGFGYNRDVHLLPHKTSAWMFFTERLYEMAQKVTYIETHFDVPAEIAEASAALQDVATRIGERTHFGDDLARARIGEMERAVAMAIRPEHDGPYLATNVPLLTNSKGERLPLRAQMALCRCGRSRMKPICDGSHADARFSGAKAAERTADRLDTYDGPEITVRDNRGTCCHAGRCTDTLPQVFNAHGEPFVNPSGASADAIAQRVRDCPSGALGGTLAGRPILSADAAPQVYVSKDGPYHVRGIALEGETFNAGADPDRYALCRCGQSKNKPFCDGSHWYVDFHDEMN
ncbi:MAG: hypothetical protein NVS1B2_25330 [Vulcanimicrobiaceae bacterium]